MTRKYSIMLLVGISFASLMAFAAADTAKVWHVPADFATIQEAIDSPDVKDGDKILVGPGYHEGAIVNKAVEIKGKGGAVIDSGPLPWSWRTFMAGFLFPGEGAGSGATISHLRFEIVEFPVFSRGANDVTVEHCTMVNPIQGISDWCGSGWQISRNKIINLQTASGGGIGILVADYRAILDGINYNVVSHNKITGILHVAPDDCGGYNGVGICLCADFRSGAAGAKEIAYNRVLKNKVSMISDAQETVDIAAIELSQIYYPPEEPTSIVIYDNAVGFNDLRGTVIQLAFSPPTLDNPTNKISRNLGENRGHGLHPSLLFRPGEN